MLAKPRRDALKLTQTSHLPFLYLTPTILSLHHHPTHFQSRLRHFVKKPKRTLHLRPLPRRHNADPSKQRKTREEEPQRTHKRIVDIPFERPQRERKDGYSELELEGSTITPNERKAFEGLFRLQRAQEEGSQLHEKGRRNGDGKISGIDEEIGGPGSLSEENGVLDGDGRRRAGMPAALRKIAKEARERNIETTTTTSKPKPSVKPVPDQQDLDVFSAAQKDLHTILKALKSANTDADVWHILQTRILHRLTIQEKNAPNFEESTSKETAVLQQTLPSHLTNTFTHLLTSFPTSTLPLSILPTLHQLGPHAVAQGASTKLYNLHLRLLFEKYPTALPSILAVLREADQEPGWEYDEETVDVMGDILVYAREVQEGKFGEAARVVWGMEGMVRALRGVVRVRDVAVERVQRGAVARAREREGMGELAMH